MTWAETARSTCMSAMNGHPYSTTAPGTCCSSTSTNWKRKALPTNRCDLTPGLTTAPRCPWRATSSPSRPQHPDYAANPEQYRLPESVDIRDLSGNILYTANGCPNLHGDASNGHMAVFGCTGGALAVVAEEGEYDHVFVPAPEGSPDDFRLTTVWGAPGADHFFALGSGVGLYVVEPEEGEMDQLIPAAEGLTPIQVALSPDGETMIVVMSDGEIRMYDTHDGEIIASNSDALSTPVETGFWARPHIALAPGAIFITDSVGGEVLQLDDHDLEVVNHWEVGGTPVKIAFVGIQGETERARGGRTRPRRGGRWTRPRRTGPPLLV